MQVVAGYGSVGTRMESPYDAAAAVFLLETPQATLRLSMIAPTKPALDPELLRKMNAYWRAANYLAVGQIYLYANPLLREPLTLAHVKPLVVGHWGTTPGQAFIYVHLNRVIRERDLDMFYIAGPGHGGAALVGNVYLEGTYSEVYPNISEDEAGMQKLFKQFRFPAESRVMCHRKRPARFTRAANSGIHSVTRSVQRSTTRI